jgi:hypothetical protein
MPNPLFIVSDAHVNKKQRRIASPMQKFSRVVKCDAFMPQNQVVRALRHADEGQHPRLRR